MSCGRSIRNESPRSPSSRSVSCGRSPSTSCENTTRDAALSPLWPRSTEASHRWCLLLRSLLELRLVLQAIRRPGLGFEALGLNGTTIDDATTIGAIVDSLEGNPHLLQNRRVELTFGEVLALTFVDDAGVASIARRVEHLPAGGVSLACRPRRESRFELEQPLLVRVYVHRDSSTSAEKCLALVRRMPLEARPASS